MAKQEATQGGTELTGKRTKTLTDQQRLRRAELKVQRIEAQLYGKVARDGLISEYLDTLERGGRGEYIKQAVYEKIAREIAARQDQDSLRAQVEDQITELRALHKENAELRLRGSIDDTPVTVLSDDDQRQQALSATMKKMSFGNLL